MTLENLNDNISLSNILVNLKITDSQGNLVNDRFGITSPTLLGLTATDGTGNLAADSMGTATFTIVPTANAAPTAETEYNIGGSFSYVENGQTITVDLYPTEVTVLPQAELYLDYFLQRNVYSDDPFTDPVETSVPFALGLIVQNQGYGTAQDLEITSAEPKIVESEQGLLIDFDLIGTSVGSQPITPSLKVNLGDITPGQSQTANWYMKSSLQGRFVEYEASFEHINGLGILELSQIKEVKIHEMTQIVRATVPNDDGLPDYLVNDNPDVDIIPDTLYFSNGGTAPVNVVSQGTTDGPLTNSDRQVVLTVNISNGWNYISLNDPANGESRIEQVLRSDGTEVLLQNVWLTDRTFPQVGRPIYENKVHLFDYTANAGNNTYTLVYAAPTDLPPVVANPINNVSVNEDATNTTLDLTNVFSDPNNDPITITVVNNGNTNLVTTSLNGNNLTLTYLANQSGQAEITLQGQAKGQTVQTSFTVNVAPVNDAPTLQTPLTDQTIGEGQTFNLVIPETTFSDVDGDTLTYSLSNDTVLPTGITFDPLTRTFSGTPNSTAAGIYNITVIATDTVSASVSDTFTLTVLNFIGTSGNDTLTGTLNDEKLEGLGGNDSLTGLGGNDTLDGGTGNDTMTGGLGDDVYVVGSSGDRVIENLDEGTDTVQSSVTHTLSDNVENLVLTGTSSISGTGNTLNNTITGNSGANTLNGSTGDDTMIGGAGNDTYTVDNVGDVITENANAGTDIVNASVSYTLANNVENLTLTGTANINGIGNSLNNSLTGNSGNNTLTGDAGNDSLNGGAGVDTLIGGAGNDSYTVDNALDVITENFNEGTDAVSASVTYTLSANVENLTLTGTTNIDGTGNGLNNTLTGNSGNNTLDGGDGNDSLTGGTGDDSLTGGLGNDNLNGGTGNDSLTGAAGNDTYTVDSTGDVVTENPNEGTDNVSSSVTYTLADNLENLTLTGTNPIDGTGNGLNNSITGNTGANTLSGGAGNDSLSGGTGNDSLSGGEGNDSLNGGTGNDSLTGGAGNDTYTVDSTGDVVTENPNEGTDSVSSSIAYILGDNLENLTLTGSSPINGTGNGLNNSITGNSGVNTLVGGAGNDTLSGGTGDDLLFGGEGSDRLTGGSGLDKFYFSDVSSFNVLGTDTLTDFAKGSDKIVLSQSLFNSLTAGSSLIASEFASITASSATELSVVGSSSALIVYNTSTGNLFYNPDGATPGLGDGGQFAILSNKPLLGISDIIFNA